jgi:hypothetical protein
MATSYHLALEWLCSFSVQVVPKLQVSLLAIQTPNGLTLFIESHGQ